MTQPAGGARDPFDYLLARLAPSADDAGQTYERLRHRLVRLFEGRRLHDPESAADETLDRLARRLAEGVVINEPAAYVLGIARMVALERNRHDRRAVPLADFAAPPVPEEDPTESARSACLDRCLAGMAPDARRTILDYYGGDGRDRIASRRRLSDRLAVSATALRLRMFRMRADLEACARSCLEGATGRPRNVGGVRDTSNEKERGE